MKAALIFSGQGSQSIGMGLDLYNNFQAAKDVFDEVDETLHEKLSELIFHGSLEELTKTQNAQPAIMSVGMAIVRTIEQELGNSLIDKMAYVAGHSLGEYTALCASKALTLRDTAKLLRLRGQAMAKASTQVHGGMLAIIGSSKEQIEDWIKIASRSDEQAFIANDNCPGQLIVSGEQNALTRLKDVAEKSGAKKVIPLLVSGAFHSPYMQPAAEELKSTFEKVVLLTPKVPVISNVTAAPETNTDRILKNLLSQITGSVRWTESIEFMVNQGVDTFIECANGKVMTGLIRRITPESFVLNANNVDTIQEVLKFLL